MPENETIRVTVNVDFSDEIMEKLDEVSDDLLIEQYFPDVPSEVMADTEILYTVDKFPDPTQTPKLRWVQLHYAGFDHVFDEPIAQAEDVEITSASGIHTVQMSEYCLAMMLAFHYQIPLMIQNKNKAEWPKGKFDIFNPYGLRGLTLGIIGYGSVGRELARIADAMGMIVLATKRNLKEPAESDEYLIPNTGDPEGDIPERLYPSEALKSMVQECDYVVATIPLTEQTRYLINSDVFDAMKKTAYFINVARGAVVDEEALISALASEEIAGAALDVFETEPLPPSSPLWNLDNVIISPHVSGNTIRYHELAVELFIENLRRYVSNQPLLNRLDRERGY